MERDFFRPHRDPAQAIYDAWVTESAKRQGRQVEVWILAERHAILNAAVGMAERLGLRVPTLEDVERAERFAIGHTDYGAKWAYGVAETMTPLNH